MTWDKIIDGTATGERVTFHGLDGEVYLEALWSDEDGVTVALDGSITLTPDQVKKLCSELDRLATRSKPMETSD